MLYPDLDDKASDVAALRFNDGWQAIKPGSLKLVPADNKENNELAADGGLVEFKPDLATYMTPDGDEETVVTGAILGWRVPKGGKARA